MTETPPEAPVQTLEMAAAEVLDNLPFPAGAADPRHTFAAVRVGPDLNDLVAQHGAVVHVRRVGGIQRTWQVTARLALTIYAAGYTDAWAAQDAVDARIGGPWQPNTTRGDGRIRIDSWRNESAAAEQPYPGLSVLSWIWRTTPRHMPA